VVYDAQVYGVRPYPVVRLWIIRGEGTLDSELYVAVLPLEAMAGDKPVAGAVEGANRLQRSNCHGRKTSAKRQHRHDDGKNVLDLPANALVRLTFALSCGRDACASKRRDRQLQGVVSWQSPTDYLSLAAA